MWPRPSSRRLSLRLPSWLFGAVALGAVSLAASPARAEPDPLTAVVTAAVQALFDLNFYSQVQAGLFAVSADDFRPGGVGARAGLNVLGIGGSVGGRTEQTAAGPGGLFLLDVELRPLPLLMKNVYRTIDPFVSTGLELGGGPLGFRAGQTLGAGFDLGLFSRPDTNGETLHPALSFRYQYRLWQAPDTVPDHLILVGASTRICF